MDQPAKPTKLVMSLDYKLVSAFLLAVVLMMLLLWRPWQGSGVTDRTIEVTGQTTVTAKPDQFVFYPSYDFKNSDKAAALKDLAAKSDEITKALKKLGLTDADLKTNSDGWSYPMYDGSNTVPVYNLRLTITVNSQDLAQKVQDYLVSTTPTGSVSPQAGFSETKRKTLEAKARDQATKEARSKAVQSAKNLGFRLAAVKTVNDSAGFGGGPVTYLNDSKLAASDTSTSLQVQPGENELSYSVTVTYFIK